MYQYLRNYRTGENRTDAIRRTSDGATVPYDAMNRDYIEYQAWLALGNTPAAAENGDPV